MPRSLRRARFDSKSSNKGFRQHFAANAALVRETKTEGSKIMPLVQLIEVLIVVGVLLWLMNRFIPMAASIKSILNGVVVIGWFCGSLSVFGLFHSLSRIRVG
jgi:hypothetical protein